MSAAATPTDTQDVWRFLSDVIDDCIGVKGKPHRLITYANVFLGLLAGCLFLLWSLVPQPEMRDRISLSEFRFTTAEGALRWNAQVLASNLWIVKMGLVSFGVCIIVLSVLINVIGRAIIADEQSKKEK